MNMTSSRPLLTRRRFLGAGTLFGAGLAISACEFGEEPQANEQLIDLATALRSAQKNFEANRAKKWSEFLGKQYDLVTEETMRQCGTDSEGNAPEGCAEKVSETKNAPRKAVSLDKSYTRALTGELGAQASLIAGLFAAYTAAGDNERPDHPAEVKAEIIEGFSNPDVDVAAEFRTLLTLTYGAIYASGVALAKSPEDKARSRIQSLADQLRVLRDLTTEVLEELGSQVPAPEPGYTQGKADEKSDAVEYFRPAVQPITTQLRRITELATNEQAVVYAADWVAANAWGEAALERLQGKDPKDVPLRGEPA